MLDVAEMSITQVTLKAEARLQVQGPPNKFENSLDNLLSPCLSQRAGKRTRGKTQD